ncbi:MAG: hypothetical protein ACI87E_000522 [Mariniblastus sp.]|jgi:hypothetical protein
MNFDDLADSFQISPIFLVCLFGEHAKSNLFNDSEESDCFVRHQPNTGRISITSLGTKPFLFVDSTWIRDHAV